MGFDNRFDNRQADARAARLAVAGFVSPVKALENLELVSRRNADPTVLDDDVNELCRWLQLGEDADFAAGIGVFQSIGQKIDENLAQLIGIGLDQDRIDFDRQLYIFTGIIPLEIQADALEQGLQVHRLLVEGEIALFDLGQSFQVLDQIRDPDHLAMTAFEPFMVSLPGPVDHGLQMALQNSQWRAQLMSHIVGQLLAQGLLPAE